jgi:heme exporter protein B
VTALAGATVIARKDLRLEMRTRDVVTTAGLFVLLVVVIASFSLPLEGPGRAATASGVLWIAFVFAALLGLGRSMAAEKEEACLSGLMLSPASPAAIFSGKLLANLGFTGLVEALMVPVFVVLLQLSIGGIGLLVLSIALGTLGILTVGTLFAAMAVNTRGHEAILPLLVLPVALPVMTAAVKTSQAAFVGTWTHATTAWLLLMAAYDLLFLLVALATFQYVTEG